jgi:hypothetical protein
MKPKTFVAIALMLSSLVAGLIVVLGYASRKFLPVDLLIFLSIFCAITIFITRNMLEDKVFTASVILMLVAISATFYLTNLKTYYDVVNEYGNPESSPEISLMEAENTYYSAYAQYLVQSTLLYQDQSKAMKAKLTELQRLQLEQALAQQEVVAPVLVPVEEIVPEPEYVYYYYENEGEEDDD